MEIENEMTSSSGPEEKPEARHKYAFTTTSWTAVMAAGQAESAKAKEALAQLCQSYWEPLYAYVRRLGHSDNDSKDLTQEFFFLLISKNYLGAVDRKKGKFRSFLLTAMKHFLANEWDKSQAQKRGGGQQILSLDEPLCGEAHFPEPASNLTPGKIFEKRWAQTLFRQAEAQLAVEYGQAGKRALFEEIRPFLDESTGPGKYTEVAGTLSMSQGAVRMAVHRARQRLAELIRAEVARTLVEPSQAEIDEELQHLFEAFGA